MKTLMAKLKVRHLLLDRYIHNANVFQANDWGALTRAIPSFCSAWLLISLPETMASHRAQLLLTLLPTALAFGMQDVEPEIELLKVRSTTSCLMVRKTCCFPQNLDTDVPIDCSDGDARFFVANVEHSQNKSREEALHALVTEWDEFDSRQLIPDAQWAQELTQHLEELVEMRIDHVRAWVESNLVRFQAGHASVMELQRTLESAVIDLKSSVQLCRMQCQSCQLFCIRNRFHEDAHECKTTHTCTQSCEYCAEAGEHEGEGKKCLMT